MIKDTYTHYSGKTKAATDINFEAWSRTLIGFIREKGLEQELKDWSGGWPCPITPFEKIGYVTAGELAHLRLGVSCIDLFGDVVPTGFEMVPVFAPSPSKSTGGDHG